MQISDSTAEKGFLIVPANSTQTSLQARIGDLFVSGEQACVSIVEIKGGITSVAVLVKTVHTPMTGKKRIL